MISEHCNVWRVGLLCLSAVVISIAETLEGRDRQCCAYAFQENSSANSICSNSQGCILTSESSHFFSPPLETCRVLQDSKKEKLDPADCLRENFEGGPWETLRFSLWPYILTRPGAKALVALELKIGLATTNWRLHGGIRFRILNGDVCLKETSSYGVSLSELQCRPRCVHLDLNSDLLSVPTNLLYDCEVAFQRSPFLMTESTSGHLYKIDICSDVVKDKSIEAVKRSCGSFYFVMPSLEDVRRFHFGEESLPLVDARALQTERKVVLHFWPPSKGVVNSTTSLYRIESDGDAIFVGNFFLDSTATDAKKSVFLLGWDVEDGMYEVRSDSPLLTLARFRLVPPEARFAYTTVIVLLLLSVVVIAFLSAVALRSLLNKRMKTCSSQVRVANVLVVTEVGDRRHVDAVLALNKLLKVRGGVGQVHFALDPETGICRESDQDPWKWAVAAAEKLDIESDYLLFVGCRSPCLTGYHDDAEIYGRLCSDQTFISTSVLRKMGENKRVGVLMFSYSDPSTIPSVLPQHLKRTRFCYPEDTLQFLLHLWDLTAAPLMRIFKLLPASCHLPMVGEILASREAIELFQAVTAVEKLAESPRYPDVSYATEYEKVPILTTSDAIDVKIGTDPTLQTGISVNSDDRSVAAIEMGMPSLQSKIAENNDEAAE